MICRIFHTDADDRRRASLSGRPASFYAWTFDGNWDKDKYRPQQFQPVGISAAALFGIQCGGLPNRYHFIVKYIVMYD